jgi:hypothetical protein
MRPGEINQAASRQSGPAPHGAEAAPAEPSATRRALVALAPAAASREAPQAYRQAPFLAHLLAMKDQHPQTRKRRRAEPAEALAAYRVTAELAER